MSGKYALIIASTEYTDAKLAGLAAPGKDAQAFAEILKAQDLCAFDEVNVLINESEAASRRAIARFFADKKPDDLIMLYFSGHGIRDEQGRLFLATKDTDHAILDATAIPADFVTREMNNSRSKRQVLILDCCNSGAFAAGTKAAAGGSMGTGSAFEGAGYGHVVLTATDSTQFAWEGEKIIGAQTTNSLFTHFLVKGLEGAADHNGDGVITVDDLYDYAYAEIVNVTPKQTPGKWSYKEQGNIVLTTQVRATAVNPIPLDANLEQDLQSPRNYVREAAVQELGRILNGNNIGRALSAEARLEQVAKTDDSRNIAQVAANLLAEYRAREGGQPKQEQAHAVDRKPPVAQPVLPVPPKVDQPQTASVDKTADVGAQTAGKAPEASRSLLSQTKFRVAAGIGVFALICVVAAGIGLARLFNAPVAMPTVTPKPVVIAPTLAPATPVPPTSVLITDTTAPSVATSPSPLPTTAIPPTVLPANIQKPADFLTWYFTAVWKTRNYEELWTYQTMSFQTEASGSYDGFVNWWSSVDRVNVGDIAVHSNDGQAASVTVILTFHLKNGQVLRNQSFDYDLAYDPSRNTWLLGHH